MFTPHWKNAYASIRRCNIFIENVTAANFDEAAKKPLLAQAKFLRAYFYKSLMDLYGGVPIITKVLNQDKDGAAILNPRNTYEECVAFIEKECEEAAADLPLKVDAKDAGRATKGAALALKGEIELYAGKWPDAAATNLAIMQSGAGYKLFPDYAEQFYGANENNSEVIFDIQYAANVKDQDHIKEQYFSPLMVSEGKGWGAVLPTQELVDCYEFLDGKTEAEGSALFDPANPYLNREKRFYASIIYDGSTWRKDVIYTRLGIPNNGNELAGSGVAGKGRTGYFFRKLIDPSVVPGTSSGVNVIIFRYAEVLLNYAEAKNEASGPDPSIYTAVNLVRTRAGLPDLPDNLTQDQMRIRIRRERRVELAFEGKRIFDLWRWRIAEEVFSQPLHGMKITVVNGKPVYERINVNNGKIKFDASKNYLFPIPQSVIAQNPKIIQNPNY